MTGEAAWLTPVLFLLGALFVLWLGGVAAGIKGLRRERRAVRCPMLGSKESLVAVHSDVSDRYVDIGTCSALRGPVTCDKACLEQLNATPVEHLAAPTR
jgi:hypothetical protein